MRRKKQGVPKFYDTGPPTLSASTSRGMVSDGLSSLCCGGEPLHKVLLEGLHRRTPLLPQLGKVDHQVHCGAGRRQSTLLP